MKSILNTYKHKLKILCIGLLTLTCIINIMPCTLLYASEEKSDFDINLQWTGSNDSTNTWNATSNETKTVRLKVNYDTKGAANAYKPGELYIRVPGIGGANRGAIKQATDVAADKADSTTKSRNWSYTYNSKTDIYTFSNNKQIDKGAVLTGSFELLWTYLSRETLSDYEKELTATISSSFYEKNSNTLNYKQTRVKDVYQITQTTATLQSARGISSAITNPNDYYWVNYKVIGAITQKAYPLRSSYFELTPETGAIVTAAYDPILNTYLDVKESNGTYQIYQNAGVNLNTYRSGLQWIYLYVAYPKATFYGDKLNVSNEVILNGTYRDKSEAEELSKHKIDVDLSKFEFHLIPGKEYTTLLNMLGTKRNYQKHPSSTSDENWNCYYDGFLDAANLYNGTKNVSLQLNGINYLENLKATANTTPIANEDGEIRKALKASESPEKASSSYQMEYLLDYLYAEQQNGQYRMLEPGEYNFTSIRIPQNTEIRNDNFQPVEANKYDVQIKAYTGTDTTAGLDKYADVGTYKILSNAQAISLPENTTRIMVTISKIDGYFSFFSGNSGEYPFVVESSFHVDRVSEMKKEEAKRIKTEDGNLTSSYRFRYLNAEGTYIGATYTEDNYNDINTGIDLAAMDQANYQGYFERMFDTIHIHEITSLYNQTGKMKTPVADNYGYAINTELNTVFNYATENKLTNFTVYALLPDGLTLQAKDQDMDEFKRSLTLSGFGKSDTVLKQYLAVSIVEKQGLTFLKFKFDFSAIQGIQAPSYLNIQFKSYLSSDEYLRVGNSYKLETAIMINDDTYLSRADRGSVFDNGQYSSYVDIWEDVNENGNREELLSYATFTLTTAFAQQVQSGTNQFVSTYETNGEYTSGIDPNIPNAAMGKEYTYKLQLETDESKAKNIVFYNHLEANSQAEWNGTFTDIDISFAEKQGFKSTIYYSTDISATENLNDDTWSTTKPTDASTVKSIAVLLSDYVLEKNKSTYIEVRMAAPSDSTYKGKFTANQHIVKYTSISVGDVEDDHTLTSGIVKAKLTGPTGKIILMKTDKTSHESLKGVTFDLYDNDDNKIKSDLVTDQNGFITVTGLEFGTYYFKETNSTIGYQKISERIEVTHENKTTTVDVENERILGSASLVKTNAMNNVIKIGGANYDLYYMNEITGAYEKRNKDPYVTDAEGSFIVRDLDWGSYYFKETKAPEGYKLNEETYKFIISANNCATIQKILATDEQLAGANVQLIKKEHDVENKEITNSFVKGAAYELFLGDPTKSETAISRGIYLTDQNGEIYVSDLAYGDYYFKERTAAPGYFINDEVITFTLTKDHISENVKMVTTSDKRKPGIVSFHKIGESGENIAGVTFALYSVDSNGTATKLDELETNSEGYISLDSLEWGDYYLKEVKTVAGYILNDQAYNFTVNAKNASRLIEIKAENQHIRGNVKLTKYDRATDTIISDKAVYTLYNQNNQVIGDYSTEDGTIAVKDLDWGSYYFIEKTAPIGYELSSELIRFSINIKNCTVTQELDAFDDKETGNLNIALTKELKKSDIQYTHGAPIFTFELINNDTNQRLIQSITFDKETVEHLTPNEQGYISLSTTFTQLVAGKYKIRESNVNRYKDIDIRVNDQAITADTEGYVLINLLANATITYKNNKYTQNGTSDTGVVKNIVTKGRQYTSLRADYHGPDIITTETIDRTTLSVYAMYDDGTEVKLGDNEYTLDPENLSGLNQGALEVKVSYEQENRKRSTTIMVQIKPSAPFTWTITKVGSNPKDWTATLLSYTGTSKVINFPSIVLGMGQTTGLTEIEKEKYKEQEFKVTTIGDKKIGKYTTESANSAIDREYSQIKQGEPILNSFKVEKFDRELIDAIYFPTENSFYTRIEKAAFAGWTGLKNELKLPNTLTSIGDGAFINCQFTGDLTIPDSINTIEGYAFYGCNQFGFENGSNGKLKLSSTLKTIGSSAFRGAGNFEDITIPSSVTTIETLAFATMDLKEKEGTIFGELKFEDKKSSETMTIGIKAFTAQGNIEGKLKLPNGLKTLSQNAFTGIGNNTILNGNGVHLIIPPTITSTSGTEFSAMLKDKNSKDVICAGIKMVQFDTYSDTSVSYATIGANYLRNQQYIEGDVNIPKGVKLLNSTAFCGVGVQNINDLSKTLHITFPSTLDKIGNGAFVNCGNIASLTFPSSITSIGSQAFMTISSGGHILGDIIFEENNNASITIGTFAFQNQTGKSLQFCDNITEIDNYAFDKFFILDSTLDSPYNLELPKNLVTIGEFAFRNIGILGDLKIPKTVTSIRQSAFSAELASFASFTGRLIFEEGSMLETIGDYVFENQQYIHGELNLPSKLKSIGYRAFSKNYSLEGNLIIPEGVTSIGSYAFNYAFAKGNIGKTNLELSIPSSVTTIGIAAFSRLSMYEYEYSKNVITKSSYGTYKNLDLSRLTNYSKMERDTFSAIWIEKDIILPPNLITIGSNAFAYTSAQTINFSNTKTLTTLDESAFRLLVNIKELKIPKSVTSIGNTPFQYLGGFMRVITPPPNTSYGYDPAANNTTVYLTLPTMFRDQDLLSNFKNPNNIVIYADE